MFNKQLARNLTQGEWIFYKNFGWHKVKAVVPIKEERLGKYMKRVFEPGSVKITFENLPKSDGGWVIQGNTELYSTPNINKVIETDYI